MTENNLISIARASAGIDLSHDKWWAKTLWTETVSIQYKRHTQKERAVWTPTVIYDDRHLLRVITHCSTWILISSLRGPSAAALKGWLEFSTRLSTLDCSQECRGRMSRRTWFRMHDWMRKGTVLFFFSFPSGLPLFGDLLLLISLLCVIQNKSACSREARKWTNEHN